MIATMEMHMAQMTLYNELPKGSRILLAANIRNLVRSHGLIAPFDEANLANTTYDLTAGAKAVVTGGVEHTIRSDSTLKLGAGEYAGIISREKICIPSNILVHLGPKKRLAYEGIILLSGSVVHPGYEGHCLFVLFNSSGSKRVISLGRKICTAVFYQLDHEVPKEELQQADQSLLSGNFPAEFLTAMANMELPTLTEVTKKLAGITQIESRICALERENKDVRQPIKNLVASVQTVGQQVASLAAEGKDVLHKISEHDTKFESLSKAVTKHGVLIGAWSLILGLLIAILLLLVANAFRGIPSAPQPQPQAQSQLQLPAQSPLPQAGGGGKGDSHPNLGT